MAIDLKEHMRTLPSKRRKKIERRAHELIAEEKTLRELRKASTRSQVQLARTLGVRQAAISKMERRTDMYVSSLRAFVEAMGGSLDIIATFPHKPPVKITQFQDLDIS